MSQNKGGIKVALIARSTLFSSKGGDTIQILETAKFLTNLGITAEIKLTDEKIDYAAYDLLHFFNITRPADILYHIKRSKKPIVISPIFIDYSEYDKYHRKGIIGRFFRWLSPDSIEYIKTLARWIKRKDKLISPSYIFKGQPASIKKILNHASMLLPNSNSEYERIKNKYGYTGRNRIIPNGIDPGLFHFNPAIKKDDNMVICVARIEGIKNQLNLIKALNNTKFRLLIIGSPATNQYNYYKECRKIAADNITFIEHVPQQELLQYYSKAKVHVLPSWFETTGLSSLEAAIMGCNVVISNRGDSKEYFEDMACYCDPGSPESIYAAIEKASLQNYKEALRKKIVEKYTWQRAALATASSYKEVSDNYGPFNSNSRNQRNTK